MKVAIGFGENFVCQNNHRIKRHRVWPSKILQNDVVTVLAYTIQKNPLTQVLLLCSVYKQQQTGKPLWYH
jgi:hypothetical protein